MADSDDSLALRAAWLHFVAGMTQSAVAKRLGLPSVKAHRLIAKAVADGAVKVTIDGDITECIDLENRLAEKYNLEYCEVTPDLGEEALPLLSLGNAGAEFLRREIEHGDHEVIGLDTAVRFRQRSTICRALVLKICSSYRCLVVLPETLLPTRMT